MVVPLYRRQAISIRGSSKGALITAPSANTSIARLDPKSGLPEFGIKLSKSETSDFDAIQYPPAGGYWIARSSRAMTAQREVNLIENQARRARGWTAVAISPISDAERLLRDRSAQIHRRNAC